MFPLAIEWHFRAPWNTNENLAADKHHRSLSFQTLLSIKHVCVCNFTVSEIKTFSWEQLRANKSIIFVLFCMFWSVLFSSTDWKLRFNTEHMRGQYKIVWRGDNKGKHPTFLFLHQCCLFCFAQLEKPLQYGPAVILRPVYPKCHWTFTWWGQTGLLTYAFVCVL